MFVHGGVLDFNKGWADVYSILKMFPAFEAMILISCLIILSNNSWIPPSLSGAVGDWADDARQWTRAINAFALCEVQQYREQLHAFLDRLWTCPSGTYDLNWDALGGYFHPQPGSRLVQYAMGWLSDRTRNPTAIYARFETYFALYFQLLSFPSCNSYLAGGQPLSSNSPALKGVAQWLNKSGIKRLCVGKSRH